MKLGLENSCTYGISIVKKLVEDLSPIYTYFKKIIIPEIYLY